MSAVDDNRMWRIKQRRRDLQWLELKRRLSRSRKLRLLTGLPSMFIFVVSGFALSFESFPAWQPELRWVMGISFLVMQLGNLWPQPEIPFEGNFDGEAAHQIDLELMREQGIKSLIPE